MNPLKIIIAIVGLGLLLGISYYLFFGGDSIRLTDARGKVEMETKKLDELSTRYTEERAVVARLQEQYTALRNGVVKRTDYFFSNPNSNNPKLLIKIKDKNVEKDLNARRLQITKLLEAWDKKIENLNSNLISSQSLPTLKSMIEEAKSNIKFVEEYIGDLGTVINELTPSGSQLEQAQIYTYQSIIEASVNEVVQLASNLNSIEDTAEEIYNHGSSNTETTVVTNSNGTPSVPESVTPVTVSPPVVTQADIQAQQEALAEVQAELAVIQQATNPTPVPTAPATPTTIQISDVYYQAFSQQSGSQTVIEYLQSLPSGNSTDRSGWPDRSSDGISGPTLINGTN